MVNVFFETKNSPQQANELIAKFPETEDYIACLPSLHKLAKENGKGLCVEEVDSEQILFPSIVVKVYFETKNNGYAEMAAKFDSEGTYGACFSALEVLSVKQGFGLITESVEEEDTADLITD